MYNYILLWDDKYDIRNMDLFESEDDIKRFLASEGIASIQDVKDLEDNCRFIYIHKLSNPVEKTDLVDIEDVIKLYKNC